MQPRQMAALGGGGAVPPALGALQLDATTVLSGPCISGASLSIERTLTPEAQ